MSFKIRPATAADAPALVAMVDALCASENEPRGHLTVERALADLFGGAPAVRALLAAERDRLLGWHLAWYAGFRVAAEARRRGVARALVAAVAAEARRQGRTFVWWCSRAGNEPANAFYEQIAEIHEPGLAHARAFDAFARLAAEGEARR